MDGKSAYSAAVRSQKAEALRRLANGDAKLYNTLLRGKARYLMHGQNWQVVDLNEVLRQFAPGAEAEVRNGKVNYRSRNGDTVVVVDIGGGYLRIQDLKRYKRRKKERVYLDLDGNDLRYLTVKGERVQRSVDSYLAKTHFLIRQRVQITSGN